MENQRFRYPGRDLLRDKQGKPVLVGIDDVARLASALAGVRRTAPLAGDLPKRDDLVYFVTHPCHPSVFGGETEPEAQRDFFGGVHARQNIVCSLVQGPEESTLWARRSHAPSTRMRRC